MQSTEHSQIRTAAATDILTRHTALVMRQTTEGYELYAEGDPSPVRCESWQQAQRLLRHLGPPEHKINIISSRPSIGTAIEVRRRI
ncbi:hypothetical protein [Edaphobacter aggregans]|uniref:hypothetical protein n=1 Tax=Edaphobacter aggregans TaxID=570835 RepID=UPI0005565D83|nr:hypothetical protein [Edaphobacter aggregans]